MKRSHKTNRTLLIIGLILILLLFFATACANSTGLQPTASLYYTPYSTLTPITPSATTALPTLNTGTPMPMDILTATPEPGTPPRCLIANEDGELYILSNKEFYDAFGPSNKELDQALADYYPEWANYEQSVQWDTEPVKLSKIIVAASIDEERFALNPAVILVTLGESLNWQLPPDSDLYLQSLAISEKLDQLTFEWAKPGNEHIQARYPKVSNGATYALYVFFNYDKKKLQVWCETYQRLFGT